MIQLDLAGLVQRWDARRPRFRPAGERIRPAEYDVAPLPERDAKTFVLTHHYAGTYPAARFRFGLYRHGDLVGVAVFSHPCADAVLTTVFPGDATASVELGRFVLLDTVPGNGETWFLARTFAALRQSGLRGVVSFSDPVARETAEGRLIFPGHVGTIYQAHNAAYLGRGRARTLRLLPDGAVFSERAVSKVRHGERGWQYAAAQLERAGAPAAPQDEHARRAWLTTALATVTRPLPHPGNHKYAWPLDRTPIQATRFAYPRAVARAGNKETHP